MKIDKTTTTTFFLISYFSLVLRGTHIYFLIKYYIGSSYGYGGGTSVK